MLGNEEDFTAALGFEVEGLDENLSALDPANFRRMIEKAPSGVPELPGCRHHAARGALGQRSTTGRPCSGRDGRLYESRAYDALEIWDRVGGGDSFASGLVYGFLAGKDPQWAVDCGAAHGALAMTTPGDTTMASLARGGARDEGRSGARAALNPARRRRRGARWTSKPSSSESPTTGRDSGDPGAVGRRGRGGDRRDPEGRRVRARDHDDRAGCRSS